MTGLSGKHSAHKGTATGAGWAPAPTAISPQTMPLQMNGIPIGTCVSDSQPQGEPSGQTQERKKQPRLEGDLGYNFCFHPETETFE